MTSWLNEAGAYFAKLREDPSFEPAHRSFCGLALLPHDARALIPQNRERPLAMTHELQGIVGEGPADEAGLEQASKPSGRHR